MKYSVRINKMNKQTLDTIDVIIPINNHYSVVFGDTVVCHIPDYFRDAKGVANGIAKILNNSDKIVLPLEI